MLMNFSKIGMAIPARPLSIDEMEIEEKIKEIEGEYADAEFLQSVCQSTV